MALKWGIRNRVLFLALIPTITISLLLGVYFIGIRLEDLTNALNDRGTAIATRLASQGEYGMFARDTDSLRNLARKALDPEISSIVFYNRRGTEIASAGKLAANIDPPSTNLAGVQILQNKYNNTVMFIAPITLPDVVIDSYTDTPENADENLKTTVIGWVKVELDYKFTRLKEYQVLIHSSLIVLLGLCISGLLALRLGKDVTEPILEVTDAVNKIKNGDLDARLTTQSHWEIGVLKSGINTMASALQVSHEQLQYNIEQATVDLRKTLKTVEVQNIELDKARKAAEAATQVKSEFLASMSHELRTPLNGIMGFINVLNKSELGERQRDFLNTMQKSAQSLLMIINDILDFSKIEAGKLHIDLRPMDIRECIEDTLTLLGPSAHDKSLELVPFIYSDVPHKILCDELRIRQVMTNLVSNAIKFTQHGSVVIRVMLEQEEDSAVTIRISVSDTGIGMNEQQQKELFRAFNQANPNITRRFGGTGLGLVICKKLVEQMHGSIDLESEEGVGSTFWFTVRAGRHEEPYHLEYSELKDISVLLYEKHETTRLAIAHLLKHWGMKVVELDNYKLIEESLQKAINKKQDFQMLIAGVNNPTVEKDFIRETIYMAKTKFNCPVGILANTTEYTAHNDILQNGATLCLAKPLCSRKFYDALRKIFITKPQLGENIIYNLPKLRILAVDDNPANLKLVSVFLENIGVYADTANSGYEALQFCKKNSYNLVLMDLHMPGIDGIETAIQIRNTDNPNSNTPIVALSAHVLVNETEKIIAAGLNDYLTKPIDENSLRASIYKWTHSGVGTQDKELYSMRKGENTPIDWDLSKKLAGFKEDLAIEMLQMLIASLPNDLENISAAYDSHDYALLREYVHRLHGACCYVGVPNMKSLAKDFETEIMEENLDKIKFCYEHLSSEIRSVLGYYHSSAFQELITADAIS